MLHIHSKTVIKKRGKCLAIKLGNYESSNLQALAWSAKCIEHNTVFSLVVCYNGKVTKVTQGRLRVYRKLSGQPCWDKVQAGLNLSLQSAVITGMSTHVNTCGLGDFISTAVIQCIKFVDKLQKTEITFKKPFINDPIWAQNNQLISRCQEESMSQ